MRSIALALAFVLIGTGTAAAAQGEPAAVDMQAVVAGCVPQDRQAGPGISAAERSAMLTCLARESARAISGQLPLRIDEITTLRSVAADGPELTYLNDVEVDAAGLSADQNEDLIETTRAYVCGQPLMRAAVSAGSSYRYIWFDRTGAEFNRLTIERCADEADEEADMASGDDLDETPPVTIAWRAGTTGAGR